jgi:hypothetical protein
MMKKILLLLTMLFPIISHAALFWASNYEECINDGKVGRTSEEMSALSKKCYNQFPKLRKLSLKKDVNLVCRDINEKSVYGLEVKGNKIKLDKLPTRIFTKTSHDKNKFTFMGNAVEKDSGKSVKIYGNISPLYGHGDIKVEYDDASNSDYVYNFTCYESK